MPSRSYDYADPAVLAEAVRTLPFVEVLQKIMDGELKKASIMETMQLDVVEVEAGRVVFEGMPGPFALNPLGTVHGGWYASLLDSALGCAVHTTLPAGQAQVALEVKFNMVRPAKLDGRPVRCEARARHVGRTTGTAEADIVDADGKLLAHGSTTCLILTL